jgi:hypothetical protein
MPMNKSKNPNIIILMLAIKQLGSLIDEVVFVGGCATGLLITDLAAPPVRMTKDVDVIIQISTRSEYLSFTKKLKERGFKEDISPDAPICRWIGDGILLDVMPTDESIIGFSSPWYKRAFSSANLIHLDDKYYLNLISVPYFLMTKCDAFDGRGNNDYYSSHDIEDIISIIDGCPEIVLEVTKSDDDLILALSQRFSQLIKNKEFIHTIPGHLLPDESSQNRIPIIMERIISIAKLKESVNYIARPKI